MHFSSDMTFDPQKLAKLHHRPNQFTIHQWLKENHQRVEICMPVTELSVIDMNRNGVLKVKLSKTKVKFLVSIGIFLLKEIYSKHLLNEI